MKVDNIVLMRHSLRSDRLTAEHLLHLLEVLLDDELELKRTEDWAELQHIHHYDQLYQLVVKWLVDHKCLDKYIGTINNAGYTKLHKIYNVLTKLFKQNIGYVSDLVERIISMETDKDSVSDPLDVIDSSLLQYNDLSYKLCYLLAKQLASLLSIGHKSSVHIIVHSSPYKRCLQSALFIIRNLQLLCRVEIKCTIRMDNFLSDYYYKDHDISAWAGTDMIQEMLVCRNEKWLAEQAHLYNVTVDVEWDKNLFGKQGEFNQSSLASFSHRCLSGACKLIDHYSEKPKLDQLNLCLVMTHGSLINNYLNNYSNSVNKELEYKFIDIPPCSFVFLQNEALSNESTDENDMWKLKASNINFPCLKKVNNTEMTYCYEKVIDFNVFRHSNSSKNITKHDTFADSPTEDYIHVKRNSSFELVTTPSKPRKNTILTTTSTAETPPSNEEEPIYTFAPAFDIDTSQPKPQHRSVIFEKSVSFNTSIETDDQYYPASNYNHDNIVSSSKDNNQLKARLSSFKLNWDSLPISSSRSFEDQSRQDCGFLKASETRRRSKSAAFYFASDSEGDSDDTDSDATDGEEEYDTMENSQENVPISPRTKPADLIPEICVDPIEDTFNNNTENAFNNNIEKAPINNIENAFNNNIEKTPINNIEKTPINKIEKTPNNNIELTCNSQPTINDAIAASFKQLRQRDGFAPYPEQSDDNLAEDYLGLNKNYSEDEEEIFNEIYHKSSSSTGNLNKLQNTKESDEFSIKRGKYGTISLPVEQKKRNNTIILQEDEEPTLSLQHPKPIPLDKASLQSSSNSSMEINTPNGSPVINNDSQLFNKPITIPTVSPKKRKSIPNSKIILIKNTNSFKSLNIDIESSLMDQIANNNSNSSSSRSNNRSSNTIRHANTSKPSTSSPQNNAYFNSPVYDNFFESLNTMGTSTPALRLVRHYSKSPSPPPSKARLRDLVHDSKENKIIFLSNSNETSRHNIF